MRELLADSSEPAARAVEVFVARLVAEIGSVAATIGGLDALVFTGGIGENGTAIREAVCRNLAWAGIVLDPQRNRTAVRNQETKISSDSSRTAIWILPTNEELIVARQTQAALATSN